MEAVNALALSIQNMPASMEWNELLLRELCGTLVQKGFGSWHEDEAMLYLVSYSFLLRVRAEALPLVTGYDGTTSRQLAAGVHSAVEANGSQVTIRLARRKNKAQGSLLKRE